jgi:cyclase
MIFICRIKNNYTILSGEGIFRAHQLKNGNEQKVNNQNKPQATNGPQYPAPPPLSIIKVKNDIYACLGGLGANSGFYIGTRAVLVIDAKMTSESAQAMLREIKKLTEKPVTTVVLTHGDMDHVNGLSGFPPGIEVIAHERTRLDMDKMFQAPPMAALRPYLPGRTFTAALDLVFDPIIVKLIHCGPAHTAGDAVVYFPSDRVAFIGDTVFISRDPLVHRWKGGSAAGLVQTLKSILALDADTLVAGHTGVISKNEVAKLLASIEEKRATIHNMAQQGKTLAEVKTSFGIKDVPIRPGGPMFPSLVEVMFLEHKEGATR